MRLLLASLLALAAAPALAETLARARDLGVLFDGTPGKYNAITDLVGVAVGMNTLISGSGRLVVGEGSVRTGVTTILPRGQNDHAAVFAGCF
jgi:D-aminopeptidase